MRILVMGFLVALWWPAHNAVAADAADFLYGQTTAANGSMPYRYFVPPAYDAGRRYPLILFLHGAGERGNDNEAQLANHANGAMYLLDDANLAGQPVFMIAPQCPSSGWWGGVTVLHAISAIDQIAAQYNIDPDRIYVTGLSMGGMGTWSAVTQRPGRFAAAVPMSGNGNTALADPVRGLPFWFFHAANDGTVNVSGSDHLVDALRDAGARVVYTRYSTGGHGIWSHAYRTPMLFHWLVSQHRGQRNESVPPTVHITSPTDRSSLFTSTASVVLSGAADNDTETVDSIEWDIRDGATGTAGGTTAWSTAAIALDPGAHLIRMIATGPSYYAPYGGHTSFNDTIRVTRDADMLYVDGFDPF